MPVVASVLVVGGGPAGCAAAVALAERGLEIVVLCTARDLADQAVPAQRMRELGVEVRTGVDLVGVVRIDCHAEAEFSDGRVENFDVVVDGHGDRPRIVAGGQGPAAAVAEVLRAVGKDGD